MSSSSFLGKSKEDYKNKKTVEISAGEDLFGTSSDGWKNVDDGKRSYSQMPLSAFKTFEWVAYGSELYERVNGKSYPRSRNSEAIMLANKVYPKLFDELKWSAEDLKAFIDKNLSPSKPKNVRENFYLGFMVSNEIRLGEVGNFTNERRSLRKDDYFEKLIYLPHIPILSGDEVSKSPLDKIISLYGENETAIIYNYGICNYHRFLQLGGMTFDEATLKIANHFKNEIIGNILKKDKEIGRKYIEGVAKNTIAWEPYSENDSCRPARNVLAWRDAFSKLWRNTEIDVTVNNWWTNYPDYSLDVIPSVKKFFASTKKIIGELS